HLAIELLGVPESVQVAHIVAKYLIERSTLLGHPFSCLATLTILLSRSIDDTGSGRQRMLTAVTKSGQLQSSCPTFLTANLRERWLLTIISSCAVLVRGALNARGSWGRLAGKRQKRKPPLTC